MIEHKNLQKIIENYEIMASTSNITNINTSNFHSYTNAANTHQKKRDPESHKSRATSTHYFHPESAMRRKCGEEGERDLGFQRTKCNSVTLLLVLLASITFCYGAETSKELSVVDRRIGNSTERNLQVSLGEKLPTGFGVSVKDLVEEKEGNHWTANSATTFPPNGQLLGLKRSSTLIPSSSSSRRSPPVLRSPINYEWPSTTVSDTLSSEVSMGTRTTPTPSSMSMSTYATAIEKPSNINLLRKLWSSTRAGKLNLTQEHQSLLRIEPQMPNTSHSIGKQIFDLQDLLREMSISTRTPPIPSPSSISSEEPSSVTSGSGFPLMNSVESETSSVAPVELTTDTSVTTSTTPADSPSVTITVLTKMKNPEPVATPATITTVDFSSDRNNRPKWRPKLSTSTLSSSTDASLGGFNGKASRNQMLYPEWLSSGGVYPDDSNNNATGEYYGEPEYETLLSSGSASGESARERNSYGNSNANSNYPEEENSRRMPIRKRINEDERVRSGNRIRNGNSLRDKYKDPLPESPASALSDRTSTESPQAIIAQSGLADVISRGRIDSVMYVYFGDNKYNDYHKEEIAGRIIQAVGGVMAAVAQVLTVLGAARCVRKSSPTSSLPVHLHIGFALLISNLLLLLAVHATEPADVCATVALILHYLHLVIGCWLFAHTVQTYRALCRHVAAPNLLSPDTDQRTDVFWVARPGTLRYSLAAWSAPFPFILMSYAANPDGYETHHYCWMSIEKGMVVSFIVPVFLLIGLNTLLVVLSLRHLLALRKLWHDPSVDVDEDTLDEKIISSGIRASAMLLPLLAIMWFLGVVALENSTSIFFQLAAAVANIALSWLVMYFLGNEVWPELWCHFSKAERSLSSSSIEEPCSAQPSSVQPGAQISFDSEPLLGASAASSSSSSSATNGKLNSAKVVVASTSSSTLSSSTSSSTVNVSVNVPTSKSLPGPSTSAACSSSSAAKTGGKKQHRHVSKKPNWSQPGGNEIYELRLDAISTIYK